MISLIYLQSPPARYSAISADSIEDHNTTSVLFLVRAGKMLSLATSWSNLQGIFGWSFVILKEVRTQDGCVAFETDVCSELEEL